MLQITCKAVHQAAYRLHPDLCMVILTENARMIFCNMYLASDTVTHFITLAYFIPKHLLME